MKVTDQTVVVWMERGVPARLFYRSKRWRVVEVPAPIVEVPEEELHPLITHPTPRRTGWSCTVRQDDSGEQLRLALRRTAAGWSAEVIRL